MTPKQEAELRFEIENNHPELALELVRELEVGAVMKFSLWVNSEYRLLITDLMIEKFLKEK